MNGAVVSATWRMVQAHLLHAQEHDIPPMVRGLRTHGCALVWVTLWGMRFTPPTLQALADDSEFLAAQARGEAAGLVELVGGGSQTPPSAPPWIVGLSSAGAPPMYLPPLVHEVMVPVGGWTARYAFTRPIYALAPVVQAAAA